MNINIGRRFFIGACLLCFVLAGIPSLGSSDTREEVLRHVFPGMEELKEESTIILKNDSQKIKSLAGIEEISRIFTYYLVVKSSQVVGYAVFDKAVGKTKDFYFLVALDTVGAIKMVKILEHRDPHGAGIKNGRFLNQFIGKTIRNPLTVHSDIQALAGATISCKALAQKVKQIVAHLHVVLQLDITLSRTPILHENYISRRKKYQS